MKTTIDPIKLEVLADAIVQINQHLAEIDAALHKARNALSFIALSLKQERSPADLALERAVGIAARAAGLDPQLLYSRRTKTWRIVQPRQLAMYLSLRAGLDSKTVGRHFGMDHKTALHSLSAVQNRIDTEPKFAATAAACLAQMNHQNPVAADAIAAHLSREILNRSSRGHSALTK